MKMSWLLLVLFLVSHQTILGKDERGPTIEEPLFKVEAARLPDADAGAAKVRKRGGDGFRVRITNQSKRKARVSTLGNWYPILMDKAGRRLEMGYERDMVLRMGLEDFPVLKPGKSASFKIGIDTHREFDERNLRIADNTGGCWTYTVEKEQQVQLAIVFVAEIGNDVVDYGLKRLDISKQSLTPFAGATNWLTIHIPEEKPVEKKGGE